MLALATLGPRRRTQTEAAMAARNRASPRSGCDENSRPIPDAPMTITGRHHKGDHSVVALRRALHTRHGHGQDHRLDHDVEMQVCGMFQRQGRTELASTIAMVVAVTGQCATETIQGHPAPHPRHSEVFA